MKVFNTILLLFFYSVGFSNSNDTTDFVKKTYIYTTKNNSKLKLDFYPSVKNSKTSPLLFYVHGGGFSGGKRDDKTSVEFAKKMTKLGYSVASISYRLTMRKKGFGCNTTAKEKMYAFNSASEDISLAVNYLIENKEKFLINKKQIILVGSSAGAEAILHLAYVYENKILPKDFKFAGLISMSGAVSSLGNINEANAIPTQLFHGIQDALVPFDTAPHHYCKKIDAGYLILHGSKAIAKKLKSINKPYYLYSVKNGNHSWAVRPMVLCIKEITDFIDLYVLQKKTTETEIEV